MLVSLRANLWNGASMLSRVLHCFISMGGRGTCCIGAHSGKGMGMMGFTSEYLTVY